jgi:hypothetical protein
MRILGKGMFSFLFLFLRIILSAFSYQFTKLRSKSFMPMEDRRWVDYEWTLSCWLDMVLGKQGAGVERSGCVRAASGPYSEGSFELSVVLEHQI